MPAHPVSPLPSADTCARIALVLAGLSGNRHLGTALHETGSALELVSAVWDHRHTPLDPTLEHRIRTLGTPAAVATTVDTTRRLGLRLLTPGQEHWPVGLQQLGRAEPLMLWVSGNPALLGEAPIVLTGTTHPDPELRGQVIDLATRIADAGWTLAATTRPGVDRITRDAALAMNGTLITLATTAHTASEAGEVVISENPPLPGLVTASVLRAPVLLAAIGGKVLLGSPEPGSGAARSCRVAHALGRPLGVLDVPGEVGGRAGEQSHHHLGLRVVSSLVEVERLI